MAEDTSATKPERHLMKGETPTDGRDAAGRRPCENTVIHGDNLPVLCGLTDETFQLIYIDPPFDTGKVQPRVTMRTRQMHEPGVAGGAEDADSDGSPEPGGSLASRGASRKSDAVSSTAGSNSGSRVDFKGQSYKTIRDQVTSYNDEFADYWGFLAPRLEEVWQVLKPSGTLYLHLDCREVHYAKVLLDTLFGRECFLNGIIWAYDYGARTKRCWPAKHDNILVYVKDPEQYYFDSESIDREPYMAPSLVTAGKAARGKLPTGVWWHTIVSPTGGEKTGYVTQKPEGILRRVVAASSRPGDWALDSFAGSDTTEAAVGKMGRHSVLVDENPQAIAVMRARFAAAGFPTVSFEESL